MHSFFDFVQILVIESALVTTAYILTYVDYKQVGTKLCEVVTKLSPRMGVNLLYQYSKYTVKWNKYWKKSYDNYWITRLMVDSADYTSRYISAVINGTRLEPYSTKWVGRCILSVVPKFLSNGLNDVVNPSVDDFRYKYIEHYQYNRNLLLKDSPLKDYLNGFKDWCKLKVDYLEEDDIELLMILKSGEQYLSRVVTARKKEDLVLAKFSAYPGFEGFSEPRSGIEKPRSVPRISKADSETDNEEASSVNLTKLCQGNTSENSSEQPSDPSDIFVPSRMMLIISVEYTHPKMETGIILDIPRGFMNVENQILSPAFVHRLLEYQNKPFYFDMDYTLKILDSRIETFEMSSEEMIVFEKTGFRVVKI